MKKSFLQKNLQAGIAIVLALTSVILAINSVEAGSTRIPVENYFITCSQESIERIWIEGGVKHLRGRYLIAEVYSNENYHAGPATNLANANIVLESSHGTFWGKVDMNPTAWPAGGWQGTFTIQGLPGDQTGVARLKGYGDLEGYTTKLTARHMPPSVLHEKFPDACGGEMPIGGSLGQGYIQVPDVKFYEDWDR